MKEFNYVCFDRKDVETLYCEFSHLPAIYLNQKLGLPLIVVEEFCEFVEEDIIVHVANLLPNGKVVSPKCIYDNLEELNACVVSDFDIQEEFSVREEPAPCYMLGVALASFGFDLLTDKQKKIMEQYAAKVDIYKHTKVTCPLEDWCVQL